jgi:hypothetical protein
MAGKKAILVIMDGWGLGKVKSADAIQNARTPFVSSLYSKYPNSTLTTCGELVGLRMARWEIVKWSPESRGRKNRLPGTATHQCRNPGW